MAVAPSPAIPEDVATLSGITAFCFQRVRAADVCLCIDLSIHPSIYLSICAHMLRHHNTCWELVGHSAYTGLLCTM